MVFSLDSLGTPGASPFWRETQTVDTKGGLFSVFLGSVDAIDYMPLTNCYLEIKLLPSTVFPKQMIVSVPFAFQADNSDKVQGQNLGDLDTRYVEEGQDNSVTSNMIADRAVTMGKIDTVGAHAGYVIKWTGSSWSRNRIAEHRQARPAVT